MNWLSYNAQMQDERRKGIEEGYDIGHEEGKIEGKIETLVNMIKAGLTTLEAIKNTKQATPSELEQIEAMLGS